VTVSVVQVEMFGVGASQDGDRLLQELTQIETDLFSSLGLHFRYMGTLLYMYTVMSTYTEPCFYY